MDPLKVRRIASTASLRPGVYAKDVILAIIQRLGVEGRRRLRLRVRAAAPSNAMSMDERMTICNMSIEGGARVGYVNPDEMTFRYLEGRPFAPRARPWSAPWPGGDRWRPMPTRIYDDESLIDASTLEPMVTWGVNPGQSIGVTRQHSAPDDVAPTSSAPPSPKRSTSWDSTAGAPIAGTPIDVAFVGSCTNGRLSDLREAARLVRGTGSRRA